MCLSMIKIQFNPVQQQHKPICIIGHTLCSKLLKKKEAHIEHVLDAHSSYFFLFKC